MEIPPEIAPLLEKFEAEKDKKKKKSLLRKISNKLHPDKTLKLDDETIRHYMTESKIFN